MTKWRDPEVQPVARATQGHDVPMAGIFEPSQNEKRREGAV